MQILCVDKSTPLYLSLFQISKIRISEPDQIQIIRKICEEPVSFTVQTFNLICPLLLKCVVSPCSIQEIIWGLQKEGCKCLGVWEGIRKMAKQLDSYHSTIQKISSASRNYFKQSPICQVIVASSACEQKERCWKKSLSTLELHYVILWINHRICTLMLRYLSLPLERSCTN